MATVNLILYKSKKLKNGKHPIVLRITKNRKRKYVSLGYACTPDQWDEDREEFTTDFPKHKQRNRVLTKELFRAEDILDEFLDDGKDFTLEDFRAKYVGVKPADVFEYFDEVLESLREEGRIKTAESYKGVKGALKNFHNKPLLFNEINYAFLVKFEKHHRNKGSKDTSIGVYMRTLRAIINRAIKDKKCKAKHYPFKEYKISKLSKATKKRAIKLDDIEKIIDFEPAPNTTQYLSKHLFLFSFYNMGMNLKDMVLLKWENVVDGRLEFKRSKTGKDFSIKIMTPVRKILRFYKRHHKGSEYIFPILDKTHKTPTSIQTRIESAMKTYNKHLKIIAEEMGIESHITSYVARHSWATILKRQGVSTSMISEMMGHSTEAVTQSYLDSFENEALDKVNELLLRK